VDVTASPSHNGSGANVSDSDGDSKSNHSSDELTKSNSDSTKRVEVAVATAAAGMTFDFSSSTIGKDRIQMMEGLCYFAKGSARAPATESPWIVKVVIFEELFTAGLCMSSHQVLMGILQKFQVQLHQLTPNAIIQLSKFIWTVSSCRG
jgi:hypothetical protein